MSHDIWYLFSYTFSLSLYLLASVSQHLKPRKWSVLTICSSNAWKYFSLKLFNAWFLERKSETFLHIIIQDHLRTLDIFSHSSLYISPLFNRIPSQRCHRTSIKYEDSDNTCMYVYIYYMHIHILTLYIVAFQMNNIHLCKFIYAFFLFLVINTSTWYQEMIHKIQDFFFRVYQWNQNCNHSYLECSSPCIWSLCLEICSSSWLSVQTLIFTPPCTSSSPTCPLLTSVSLPQQS